MIDDLKHIFRQLKVHLLGKGVLTLGVFAAAAIGAATGLGVIVPAAVVCFGGIALTAADRLYQQRLYEEDMVNLYRDNIAQQLGKQPGDVTRSDLKAAAEGNDVIAQALQRQRQRTLLSIGTSIVSGLVSLTLIAGFGVDKMLHGMAEAGFVGMLAPIASFVGIGTVSGLTGLVLRDGLGSAIGYGTGISKAAAHDLIVKMDTAVTHGAPIAREDVYAIIVAANPALDAHISKEYGRHYASMSHAQQARVLHDVGLAEAMDKLAVSIAQHRVHAGTLAYTATDPHLSSWQPSATAQTPSETVTEPTRGTFTERLGLVPREKPASYTERLAQERAVVHQAYSTIL